MVICILVCHFLVPGCRSLKEKRSQIKPLIARIHREFNVSVAEIDKQDMWNEAVIACALVSNQRQFAEKNIGQVLTFINTYWKNLELIDHTIEFI